MSATIYADTSLLASLCLADENTPAARAAVAAALQLKATRFLTLDTRQRALARAAGLRTS
jgi:hypothetical protein